MDKDIKIAVYLFIALSAVFFVLSNGFPGGDSEFSIATCESIFKGGGFGLAEPIGLTDVTTDGRLIKGRDGRYYSMFGLGWILALIPFYAIGIFLSKIFTFVEAGRITSFTMAMLQAITVSGTASLLYLFARKMNFKPRASISLGILYSFTTTAFVYSKGEGIDYPNAFFVLGSFYYLYRYKLYRKGKDLFTSGFFIGLALSLKIIDILILPVSILYLLFILKDELKNRMESLTRVLLFLIWPIIFLLAISWYNAFRFGAFYLTGYHVHMDLNFAPYYIHKGLYGYLFSSGKSVFIFNPPLLLSLFGYIGFKKRCPLESNVILLATIPSLLLFSNLAGWEGGYAWGPRYLAPFLPLWLLFSLPLIERSFNLRRLARIIMAVFIAGILIQLPAVMMNYNFSYDLARSIETYQRSPGSTWGDTSFKPSLSPLVITYKLMAAYMHNLFAHPAEYININDKLLPLTKSYLTPSPWIFQIYKLGYSPKVKMLAISLNLAMLAVAGLSFFRLYKHCRIE